MQIINSNLAACFLQLYPLFVLKLMFLLDECKQFQHIISWLDNGQAFMIHNSRDFEERVLPVIFKEARFSSFLRKVCKNTVVLV